MKRYNVISCFDGLSGGQLAMGRAGLSVNNYYASEIDKYAMQVTRENFPDTLQLGDVTRVTSEMFREEYLKENPIDLLMGGSPCQGFSFAGKNLNFDDPRSKLFFEFVRIKEEFKPKYFLLENVKMKKESQDIISKYMGVEPIEINSSLVSAQNRKRLYWTNIPFDMPIEDKGLVLRDILEPEENIEPKYLAGNNLIINYRGGNQLNPNYKSQANTIHDKSKKSPCVCAGTHGYAIGYVEGCVQVGEANLNGHDILKRVYSVDAKSPTVNACTGGNREPKIMRAGSIINRKINPLTGKRDDYNPNIKAKARIEVRADDKTGCLTTVQKDNVVVHEEQRYWRKLTPLECERLQTLPDNYTDSVSNTQRYKMIGNGWTVDVIAHILKGIK
jgi:DNA (cytosine-5)-methyltransferase 3A